MKTFAFTILSTLFIQSAFANEGLNKATWDQMISDSIKEAKVVSTSHGTIIHGGVFIKTFHDAPKFIDGRKGNASLALFNEFSKRLSAWSQKNGASKTHKSVSHGQLATCVKAKNGDAFSTVYQPAYAKDSQGNVTITFVDASEFSK